MTTQEYRALLLKFKGTPVPEALSGVLFLNGCQGIYEAAPDQWVVYFPGTTPPDQLRALTERLRHQFESVVAAVEEQVVPREDWNARWRQYFKPIEITETLWVRPPWEQLPPQAGGLEIVIQPQMGFGTGHHETTRLMLQWMMTLPLKGKSVLDVGTGSGILAILARKLGAGRVVAVDIDADAIDNARENLELNAITGVTLVVGDIQAVPQEPFDVILANIQLPVLQQLGEAFSRRLAPSGRVLVSGLLDRDAGKLIPVYASAGLTFVERRTLGEWVAELYQKEER